MKWETVIGVEVHVETNTKTKMFCSCSAEYFGKKPNTHVCPVCLGLPGALPYVNEEALEKCIKIGLALGCTINPNSLFERKNYFYPDLPKGYQISQLRWPLCTNGSITVEGKNGVKTIRINRAHQEEDTGKLSHKNGETFIDFNRSGVPLVEVVTEADFRDSSEVRDYGKKLQQIIKATGVSNADMEKGDMRLEANVSVRPQGQEELAAYRVELKNINSFKFIADAIDFEVERQIKLLEKGEKISQQTRGYNEDRKETFLQRVKEEANDYRYFPDPDLPSLEISQDLVEDLSSNLEELPDQLLGKLTSLGLSSASAKTIAQSHTRRQIFSAATKIIENEDVVALGNFFANTGSKAKSTEELIEMFKINQAAKSQTIDNEEEIEKVAKEVISENPQAVSDYKSGKQNAIGSLIGKVMQKTKGNANAQIAKEILEKLVS